MDRQVRESAADSEPVGSQCPPALVFGAGSNGLSFVRSLGRRGIPVLAVDLWMRPGLRSRYCRPILVPNPQKDEAGLLRLLEDLGRNLPARGILLSTTDSFTLFLSKHAEGLRDSYDFNIADHETIRMLANKRLQYEYARKQGVAIPRTVYPDETSVESVARDLDYPCIIKPYFSHLWRGYLNAHGIREWGKVLEARSPRELVEKYHEVKRSGLDFLVQDKISGGDDRLYGLLTYFDRSSRPLGAFTKRKLRQYPREYGNGSLQISVRDAEVEELGLRLLRGLNFRGLAGVEFKRDPVDEQLRLIEINPRSISQTHHAVACGVDIPYIAYRDSRGDPAVGTSVFREGVKWISLEREVGAFLEYRRAGDLDLATWLRSWKGQRCYAFLAKDDPMPAVADTIAFLRAEFSRRRGSRKARVVPA